MQATSRPAAKKRSRFGPKIRPVTLAVGAFAVLLSLGVMIAVLGGAWPLAGGQQHVEVAPTPWPHIQGLRAEITAPPRKEGEQWLVPVKVTNNVLAPARAEGTATANQPPAATPSKVLNATIRVLFYDKAASNNEKHVVGSGIGNVTDLDYNTSKTIEVVATNVGQFAEGGYEVFTDSMWTDKDVPKGNASGGSPSP